MTEEIDGQAMRLLRVANEAWARQDYPVVIFCSKALYCFWQESFHETELLDTNRQEIKVFFWRKFMPSLLHVLNDRIVCGEWGFTEQRTDIELLLRSWHLNKRDEVMELPFGLIALLRADNIISSHGGHLYD